jgi:hypothetical protein
LVDVGAGEGVADGELLIVGKVLKSGVGAIVAAAAETTPRP